MDTDEIIQLVKVLGPPLINWAEQWFGSRTGAQKKAAVVGALAHVAAANPSEVAAIGHAVEGKLSEMKADGTLGGPIAKP